MKRQNKTKSEICGFIVARDLEAKKAAINDIKEELIREHKSFIAMANDSVFDELVNNWYNNK